MPSVIVAHYTRREIRANPDRIYVFGDNLERRGFGGQAKEARGEPNAIGIPTKRSPERNGYLSDADFEIWRNKALADLTEIRVALNAGKTVVWPRDGIGTGRAQLKKKAPKIWAELQARISALGGLAEAEA